MTATWTVECSGSDPTKAVLTGPVDKVFDVALGRSGIIAESHKREGDGATPAGRYRLEKLYYRADRVKAPISGLDVKMITPQSGWCDDPTSKRYNKEVSLPHSFSHEKLWRSDVAYDHIVSISHNMSPVIENGGSAIFIHQRLSENQPTEGGIALWPSDMPRFLRYLQRGHYLIIKG